MGNRAGTEIRGAAQPTQRLAAPVYGMPSSPQPPSSRPDLEQTVRAEERHGAWTRRLVQGLRTRPLKRWSTRLALPLATALTLGITGWVAADRWYAAQARQKTADHWSSLRRCLLGDGLPPGERPSERFRRIAQDHTEDGSDEPGSWPQRCAPHANALDLALANPAMQRALGGQHRASVILDPESSASARGAALDTLYIALSGADLPPPQVGPQDPAAPALVEAPEPAKAQLDPAALDPLGQIGEAGTLSVDVEPTAGRALRILLASAGAPPVLCRLDDGPKGTWASTACRTLAWTIPANATSWRLAQADADAPELIYVRTAKGSDGFYDAASGQRIWRPRFADAQAVVHRSGEATSLYAVPKEGRRRDRRSPPIQLGSASIDHHRLVRLQPGRAPSNRRLRMPSETRPVLFGKLLVWTTPAQEGDQLFARTLMEPGPELSPTVAVGTLAAGARHADSCASEGLRAVLFTDEAATPRYSLLLAHPQGFAPPLALGALDGPVALHCAKNTVHLTVQREDHRLAHWQCTAEGCRTAQSDPLPELGRTRGLAAATALGEHTLVLWSDPSRGLRMRLGAVAKLREQPDAVLLDPAGHRLLHPTELQLFSRGQVAVALIRTASHALYGVRIESNGTLAPITASR